MMRALGWLRDHPATRRTLLLDSLSAGGVFTADLLLVALGPQEDRPDHWWVPVGLGMLVAFPVALRRTAPWVAIGVALVSMVGTTVAGYQPPTIGIAFIWLTYSTAAHFPVRRAVLAAAVLWLPALTLIWVIPDVNRSGLSAPYVTIANTLIALVGYLVGRVVSTRRAYTAALEERAQAAEANQRALAEQAVADERRRIARELHDVVAHHVSVTGVLATGARRMLRRHPDAADEALASIEETSRTALREMRRLLTVLRTEAEPDAVELTPQPDLAGIDALVEQVREAGLPLTLRVEGTCQPLDPGVALTVYRIVQEALTNTLKHAGNATAEVRLSFGTQWLVVEVADTGRGPVPVPDVRPLGHGLVGMRERVSLYGGTLRTGPRPGGGFRVYARIPIDALNGKEPA